MHPSTEAHNQHESSGRAATNREKCLELVRSHPGSTAVELWKVSDMDRHDVSRRLPELATMGLVVRGEVRKCRVKGSSQTTWYPKRRDTLFDME